MTRDAHSVNATDIVKDDTHNKPTFDSNSSCLKTKTSYFERANLIFSKSTGSLLKKHYENVINV